MSRTVDMLDRFFRIKENGSDIRTEIKGGVITFLAMSYILVSNPAIISSAGVDIDGIFTATALSAMIGCLLMGLYARFPVALAPGMGINAFVAYTVVLGLGFTYSQALMAVLISGIIFFLVSISGFRIRMLEAIPSSFRLAIAAGIGLFIAFVGLQDAGIVTTDSGLLGFGDLGSPEIMLGILCIFVTFALWFRKWWGAAIGGVILSVIIGLIAGIIELPSAILANPNTEYFGSAFSDIGMDPIMIPSFIVAIFSLLMVDMFDSAGTLLTVGSRAGLIDDSGKLEKIGPAMTVDSVSTVIGATLGTTTTTSFVESASGIESGARTGLMAVVVGVLFAVSIFLGPIFSVITFPCIVGTLVLVGAVMMSSVKEIEWGDPIDCATAFVTIAIMTLSYSISNGIGVGAIVYVLGKVVTGKGRDVNPFMYLIAVLFLVYFTVYYAVLPTM